MYKSISSFAGLKLKAILLVATAALLTGCTTDGASFDDQYVPSAHYERYPIKVAKAPMRLEVKSRAGGLQPSQINAVANFARSAAGASASQVSLSGSGAIADQVHKMLISNGVKPGQISRRGRGGHVVIEFTRAVAVTKECGDWSEDINYSPKNEPYPNFGCSIQNNVAQMVSNPTDFEIPEATTPAMSSSRSLGYAYYAPSIYTPPIPPSN